MHCPNMKLSDNHSYKRCIFLECKRCGRTEKLDLTVKLPEVVK